MFLADLIAGTAPRLTPTDRRIAEAVLEDPTLLAFGTVASLAERVGTSPPSVVRFATKLGFGGYSALQEKVREGLSDRLGRPAERIRLAGESLAPMRRSLESAQAHLLETLDEERLTALSTPLVEADRVWILTGETSAAGGLALASGLTMVRPGVHRVEEHAIGRDLGSAARGDAAVVIDFPRYRRRVIAAARHLADVGARVVALTDGPLSPLAALAECWCGLEVPAIGPFDSSVPAVTAAELIVAKVAARRRDEAQARIDRTEALWESTDAYLD